MKKEKENDLEKKVKIALAEIGQTQASIARKMGISTAQLSHWLKGVNRPSTKNLEKLAGVLEKPINYFFENSYNRVGNNSTFTVAESSVPYEYSFMQKEIEIMKKDIENINLRMQILEGKKKKK